jgi:hypothetical protein
MTGCNSKELNYEKPKCYYPKFPKISNITKTKLKNMNDNDINYFIKQLVIYKEKVNIMKNK